MMKIEQDVVNDMNNVYTANLFFQAEKLKYSSPASYTTSSKFRRNNISYNIINLLYYIFDPSK